MYALIILAMFILLIGNDFYDDWWQKNMRFVNKDNLIKDLQMLKNLTENKKSK